MQCVCTQDEDRKVYNWPFTDVWIWLYLRGLLVVIGDVDGVGDESSLRAFDDAMK